MSHPPLPFLLLLLLLLLLQRFYASALSPIDTEHDCYSTNRVFRQELRRDEETPLVSLLEILDGRAALTGQTRAWKRASAAVSLRGGSCAAQKTQDACNRISTLELKTSRKPLNQCSWCSKMGASNSNICVSCRNTRAKEKQGYTCAPDTTACNAPPPAICRGAACPPPPPPPPPKVDPPPPAAAPCGTTSKPCELGGQPSTQENERKSPGGACAFKSPCNKPCPDANTLWECFGNSYKTCQSQMSEQYNMPNSKSASDNTGMLKRYQRECLDGGGGGAVGARVAATPKSAKPTPEDEEKERESAAAQTPTPEERAVKPTNSYDEPSRYGSTVIAWSPYQLCERLVRFFGGDAAANDMRIAPSPPAAFAAQCLGMLGNVCLPQCRQLGALYDEASRPGAGEFGGLDGNNNAWDASTGKGSSFEGRVGDGGKPKRSQGRWDATRGIPAAAERSDEGGGASAPFGPVPNPAGRVLAYHLTQADCVKCVVEADCVPDCLLDGSCAGESSDQDDMVFDYEGAGGAAST